MTEITLKLKSPTLEKQVKIKDDGTIKDLRDEAAKSFEVTSERVCLIHAGKILKDESTLAEHKLRDSFTVHVVIKQNPQRSGDQSSSTASTGSASLTPSSPNPPSRAFDPLTASAARFLSSADTSPSSLASMQQTMQQQVMNNPELLRNVMQSPLVHSLMSNPEVMRSIMQSNPQIRELMERNPELGQMLTNPDVLRQSMEIASNPSLMQEMMRSCDRAVLNLESIPGGSSHLQRIYESVQEPMLNAMQGGDANNPFADLAGNTNRQAVPSNEPMPNPWVPLQEQQQQQQQQQTSTTTTSTGVAGSTGGVGTGLTAAPSALGGERTTTSLLGGIPFNPATMSSAFQTPYVRQMVDAMTSNPETFEAFLSANPMWSGANQDPAMREHLRQRLPHLARQMSRPEFVGLLSNPRALQAMAQIQDGLRILQEEAPDVFASMTNVGQGAFNLTGVEPATTTAASTESTTTRGVEDAAAAATVTPATAAPGNAPSLELASLMASLLSAPAPRQEAGISQQQQPELRYASQLETLASMGFTNRASNLQALISCHGDVNAVIDRLLRHGNQ